MEQIDKDTESVIIAVGAHKDGCKFGEIGAADAFRFKGIKELDVLLQRVKRQGYTAYTRANGDGPKLWQLTARGRAEHKRIVQRQEATA